MTCRFCSDTGIWISPVYGAKHPCLECKNVEAESKTDSDQIQYDEGSGIPDSCGYTTWTVKGEFHRPDGPAVTYTNGTKFWYLNRKLHREDGPACEYANGTRIWYVKGKKHREDGPAFEYGSGTKYWHVNDKEYTEEEFNNLYPSEKKFKTS